MTRAEVDSEALRAAARSACQVGESLAGNGAGTVLDSAAALAGTRSGPALASAASSWKAQVQALADDLRSFGDRLASAADQYEAADDEAAEGLRRILGLLNRVGVSA
ncbi:hypothetical protein SZMC14600_12103 [Saccharomonospora azurea SZMC 14600]|uniref:type VII secretion target n=1 Tax=Saccharomonospora azurea TaxID=40988 RepID=UPI00023FF44A|nr:type VII secretion target [Saccharomonospora azurea]EHK80099.1 hypothetical protein SZMC14600_23130 [Saccharomonospora azurea SZMC 14600]EHK87116.1 hypothetical protein SZMC14600_12103 [Saccharomonospora azurea SZMC 14600]